MKRAAEEERKKHPFVIIKGVDREAINKLRGDIIVCAEALQEGRNGVQRFNPEYFKGAIEALGENIMSCHRKLEKAWFSGFFKEEEGGPYQMVTTAEIRRVSIDEYFLLFVLYPLS